MGMIDRLGGWAVGTALAAKRKTSSPTKDIAYAVNAQRCERPIPQDRDRRRRALDAHCRYSLCCRRLDGVGGGNGSAYPAHTTLSAARLKPPSDRRSGWGRGSGSEGLSLLKRQTQGRRKDDSGGCTVGQACWVWLGRWRCRRL